MSTPWRIFCRTWAEVPDVSQLRELATEAQHVVLMFPQGDGVEEEKKALIQRLADDLLDYSVFDSGRNSGTASDSSGAEEGPTTCVTVLKVLSYSEVLANADSITEAACQFRDVATDLMTRLAHRLKVPIEAFANPMFRMTYKPGAPQPKGRLDRDWDFFFHGAECGFLNRTSRQDVDVILGFLNEFGVLDPMFLARFVRTTPGLEAVAHLFRDDYHYPVRALLILHREGYLTRVYTQTGDWTRSGLVAYRDKVG